MREKDGKNRHRRHAESEPAPERSNMERPCIRFNPYYGRLCAFTGGTITLRKTFEEAREVVCEYHRKMAV